MTNEKPKMDILRSITNSASNLSQGLMIMLKTGIDEDHSEKTDKEIDYFVLVTLGMFIHRLFSYGEKLNESVLNDKLELLKQTVRTLHRDIS